MNLKLTGIYSACFIFLISIFGNRLPFITKSVNHYPEYEKEALISLMKESKVIAEINEKCSMHKDMHEESGVVMMLLEKARVEIIKEHSLSWYYVKDCRIGKTGWVRREFLDIPPDIPANLKHMNKAQLEGYANVMGFESDTNYFVLTDIDRQQTDRKSVV